jgi:exonuclease SbcD
LERIDFGEEGDPKGFCWVELERHKAKWRFIQSKARPFVTLRADLRLSVDPTKELLDLIENHDLREAVTRIIVELTPETEARLNEGAIRDALRRAGVSAIAAIRKNIEQPARARLGGSPEGMTDTELMERYLISKQVDEDRRTRLLSESEAIFFEVAGVEQDAT